MRPSRWRYSRSPFSIGGPTQILEKYAEKPPTGVVHDVEYVIAPEISDRDLNRLAHLSHRCFQKGTEAGSQERWRTHWQGYAGPSELAPRGFLVRDEGDIVANASVIPRVIETPRGREFASLLAAVMTHPDHRGKGYGKAVVATAFSQVTRGDYRLSIFQTGAARGFYEKLGCRLITSPIVNSLNTAAPTANPMWDEFAMIFPDIADWPEGIIDLLGPAV